MCSSWAARTSSRRRLPNGADMALKFSSSWSMSVMLGMVVVMPGLLITQRSAEEAALAAASRGSVLFRACRPPSPSWLLRRCRRD